MRHLLGNLFAGLIIILFTIANTDRSFATTKISDGITYELIGEWDTEKLNEILLKDSPEFFGITIDYTPATNGVKLYRITYPSIVPEKNNKPIMASGLLAVPDLDEKSFPLVSYQHGTVFGKEQVPSFPEQSGETRLMIAQFAGQGYVLIGADYFGMGTSGEPEGYLVKASHQQATFDLHQAASSVLESMGITTSKLFLGGWSQGGFVTMALTEKLENSGIAIDAVATASGPTDAKAVTIGALNFPRSVDANWYTLIFILTGFSFEEYYGLPGLTRSLFNEDQYEVARKIYERDGVTEADLPTDLKKLIRPEYFDTQYFESSAYGRLIGQAEAYKQIFKSPIRNYYGDADEVITIGVGRMAADYQNAIGSGNKVIEAISTGETNHRETFATAVKEWKQWFDGL